MDFQCFNIALFSLALSLSACAKSQAPETVTLSPKTTVAPQGPLSQGTINGGGGVGLRCGSKLEMLDLFEAREDGLTFPYTVTSAAETATLIAEKFARHFWNPESVSLQEMSDVYVQTIVLPILEGRPFKNHQTGKMEDVRFVESLPLSHDFGRYQIPVGCQLEQIAFFSDTNTQLSIVKSAWDQLDWLSKAVLVAHELVYMVDRRDGLETLRPGTQTPSSESSRKFVGQILSKESLPTRSFNLAPQGQLYRCSSDSIKEPTYFYAFNDPITLKLSLVFKTLLYRQSFYQMRSEFKDLTIEDLVSKDAPATKRESADVKTIGLVDDSHLSVRVEKVSGSAPSLEVTYRDQGSDSLVGRQSFTCELF